MFNRKRKRLEKDLARLEEAAKHTKSAFWTDLEVEEEERRLKAEQEKSAEIIQFPEAKPHGPTHHHNHTTHHHDSGGGHYGGGHHDGGSFGGHH